MGVSAYLVVFDDDSDREELLELEGEDPSSAYPSYIHKGCLTISTIMRVTGYYCSKIRQMYA